jgi:hypothetical protein
VPISITHISRRFYFDAIIDQIDCIGSKARGSAQKMEIKSTIREKRKEKDYPTKKGRSKL